MSRKRKRPSSRVADRSGPPRKRTKDTPKLNQQTSQGVHHPVISRYYPRVVSLRAFLLASLPSSSKSRRRKVASIGLPPDRANGSSSALDPVSSGSTSNKLADLLDNTLIGILKQPDEATTQARQRDLASFTQSQTRSSLNCTDTGATCPQSEIVDFAVLTLFNRSVRRNHEPQHILCHGFQRAGPRHEYEAMTGGIRGVVPLYPNQNVSILKGGAWADILGLLGKSGEEIMMRLLLDCGIFISAHEQKGNYYQLSGVQLSELEVLGEDGQKKSNGKPHTEESTRPSTLHTPGNIIFVRRRMLYSRAVLNTKGGVRFGLKHKHVLNRCPDNSHIGQTVHLMKYIFPRQFGLHNVFTSRVNFRETVQPFKDYTVREDEIEAANRTARMRKGLALNGADGDLGKVKLPKRLRGELVSLIQKLQKRHTRCAYTELLKYYCPAEKTATPSTQTSLTDFATPTSAVSAFCRATLRKLIPNELYGVGEDAVHNREHISKFVDIFIRMRKFESLSLHQVVQNMKIAGVRWLKPPHLREGNSALSASDLRKRTEIFYELVYYIFDSLLIPLVRSNFYVTDSNLHRNRLFYFRHDVWRKLTEPTLAELKTSVFEEIRSDKAKRILNQRSLGFSQLRLLPKTTGARPITNLRRRAISEWGKGKGNLGPSINSLLTPVFNMLGYEKERQPEKLGSAIFSVRDIYSKLRGFREKLRCRPAHLGGAGVEAGNSKPLFFVKLDIKSCFDTIPQHELVQLAERLVSEDEYRMTKHVEFRKGHGDAEAKPTRKFVTKAHSVADFASLLKTASDGSSGSPAVFVDTTTKKRHHADDLLYLLEEHVRMNLVRIGKKYYRQKNGIPQGSVLSSILCNFFYGDLENEILSFLHHEESLLLRLIDDFLLITTDRSRATRFLELMIPGQPDYGITVNPQKSLVNFPITVNDNTIPRCSKTLFPYCGSLINTRTLEISREDPALPQSKHQTATQPTTSDALTITTSQSPVKSFHRKTVASFKLMSSNPMFLDTSHNSRKVVARAIYGNFLSSAMRMERYLRELRRHGNAVRSNLVQRTMEDLMDLGVRVVRTSGKRRQGFECSVTNSQIKTLAVRAFRCVFGRRQTGYREVVEWLDWMAG